MSARPGQFALSVLCALVTDSCARDATGNAALVQIASFRMSPGVVSCGSLAASPDTVALQIEMVNTTDADASVMTVGSYGTVIRTATGEFVGTTAAVFDALPYIPRPALVIARSGDVMIRVSLPTASLCFTNIPAGGGFKDVQVSGRVSTNSGHYTTGGAILHVTH
jgi:hypothetical protein